VAGRQQLSDLQDRHGLKGMDMWMYKAIKVSIALSALIWTTYAAGPAVASGSDRSDSVPVAGAPAEIETVGPSVHEDAQPRRGRAVVDGKSIAYIATPGTLTVRDTDGAAVASMFYVAYTVERRPAEIRPITFVFNGGPGSSTMWLHMGGLGPFRVDVPSNESLPPAPYRIVPSDASILDETDLVFIDAIGTGLSRPLGKAKAADFWTVDADIDSFAKAIRRYLELNDRWNSPKFLMGESYGALRAAGLAHVLQEQGIQTNGVLLISAVLNYSVLGTRSDEEFVRYLPSLAAVAWFHEKIPNRPTNLETLLKEVKAFALGPYLTALAQGDDLPVGERDRIAAQMSRYTGLSTAFLIQSHLRVPEVRFRQELLRAQDRIVGRIDARFAGIGGDSTSSVPDYDSAETSFRSAFIAALNTYLFGTLGYKSGPKYRPEFYEAISDAWDFRHRQVGVEDTAVATVNLDLASVMRQNPHLRVIELHGYYDLACPFFGAETDLKHLELDPVLRANLTMIHYESGHMIYIQPEARQLLSRDIKHFYSEVLQHP
jgi:carboxypeptidase C (cathepsin A)